MVVGEKGEGQWGKVGEVVDFSASDKMGFGGFFLDVFFLFLKENIFCELSQ